MLGCYLSPDDPTNRGSSLWMSISTSCSREPEAVGLLKRTVLQCMSMNCFQSNPTTAWTANDNKVAPDTSCSKEISVDVAKARWASYSAGSDDRILNPIINCFCQQEALSQGPGFAFPPYDTEEKQICEAWILNNAAVVGKVIGAAMAVLVINQVLLLIYEYLVAFERHCTVTEVTLSQFWKLFLAQMVNTALLVLLVNASLEIPPVLQFLRVLQIGSGQFDELSVTWYVSVGHRYLPHHLHTGGKIQERTRLKR